MSVIFSEIAMTPTASTAYTQSPDQLILTLLRAGWSQERIAHAVDVSQPTICRIYSGRHKNPRYNVVEGLRHLVMSLDDFKEVA